MNTSITSSACPVMRFSHKGPGIMYIAHYFKENSECEWLLARFECNPFMASNWHLRYFQDTVFA